MRVFNYLAGGALALAVAAAGAQEIAGRKEIKRVDVSGAPGMEIVTATLEVKPGETIPLHLHHGIETAYVIQGATLQHQGEPPQVLHAGDALTVLRDVVHGGATVSGPMSLKVFTVHVVDKGKTLYEPVVK